MNEIPIFQDVDTGVLNVLCRDSTDDLSQVISVTNVAKSFRRAKFRAGKVPIRPDFAFPQRGKCLSCRIGIVPAGESGYPDGLGLSPQGKVVIRQDLCCPRWGGRLSERIGGVD